MNSYRVLWLCHRRLTPRYRQLVGDVAHSKRVHHLRSAGEMKAFLQALHSSRSIGVFDGAAPNKR